MGQQMAKLKRNRAQCRKCGDVIESRTVHDFRQCKCGAMFVDGGLDYLRRGGDLDKIHELSYNEGEEEPQPDLTLGQEGT